LRRTTDEIILPVPNVDNLFVIPADRCLNPAEMLLDPKLKQLFESEERFDIALWIPRRLISE
jgi:hypothetical protein